MLGDDGCWEGLALAHHGAHGPVLARQRGGGFVASGGAAGGGRSAHPPDAASGGHRGRGQVGRLTSRGPTHGPARLLEGALLARARLHGRAPRRPFASCRWRRARARFHLARRTEADEHQPRGNDALEVRRALAMFDDARFVQTRRRVLVCDGPSARPPALVATAKK